LHELSFSFFHRRQTLSRAVDWCLICFIFRHKESTGWGIAHLTNSYTFGSSNTLLHICTQTPQCVDEFLLYVQLDRVFAVKRKTHLEICEKHMIHLFRVIRKKNNEQLKNFV